MKYEANGWKSIILMERGAYFHSYQYEKRAKTKGGRVYVEMRSSGAALFHEGYITSAEASRAAKKDDDGPAAIKPEMSGPVAEYIAGHRHAATRASLLGSSGIALRLMIAHMLVGSNLWTVHRHMSLAKKEDTQKSLENARATQDLNAARTKAFALFEALGVKHVRQNGEAYHLVEVFAALLALTDEETHEIMTVAMADRIDCGSPIVEALAHVLGTDMSAYWKPDPAFF
jgi:ParB family chromosome partitioning protein